MPLDVEKAFVVTISQTGNSLSKHHEVLFLGPSKRHAVGSELGFRVLLPNFSGILWVISRLYSRKHFDRIAVIFIRIAIKLVLRLRIKSLKSFAIWTRDVRISIFTSNLRLPTICEVHKELTDRERVALTDLICGEYLALGPISQTLLKYCNDLVSRYQYDTVVVYLPMAAASAFFSEKQINRTYKELKPLRIGYFGSFESMQVKSGIDCFIELLSQVVNLEMEILLVGIGREGRQKIESQLRFPISPRFSIHIIDRVPHLDVPRLMQSCHILVLPYVDGSLNRGRFPIKAVEYAASKVPILCSDTVAHRTILGEDRAFFYRIEDGPSLLRAVEEIVMNDESRGFRVANAYAWAKSLTYEHRATTILNALSRVMNSDSIS